MAEKVIKTTFKLRRGNAATYATKNITLAAGEPAFELDTGRLKIGDGNTEWNALPYINDKEFVYKPGGSVETFKDLEDLQVLKDSNIGYVYNIQEGFITTENFIEGKDKYYSAGTDVAIIKIGEKLWYNIYGGFVDLSDYATKNELNSKQSILDAQKGILIDNENKIKLEEPFYDYLVKQTFKKPTIAEFAITGLGGATEIGTSVEVSAFTHRETNTDNFDGTLTLKKGNDVLAENIAPDDTVNPMASGSFPIQTVTSNTAATVTFTLFGKDKLNEDVIAYARKTFYVPKIYGVSVNSTVTPEDLADMTHVQNYANPTTVQMPTDGYIFLAVTGTITKVINADTTYPIPVSEPENMTLSINGVSVPYHVYHTEELTAQPPLKMTITVS